MTTENQAAGTTAREDFAGTQIATQAETASTAVAAQARAEVESRYILALKRPRDWDMVRVGMLKECQRPGFAEVARYKKPIGKGVEGFSIRFAEAAMRHLGNLLPQTTTVFDDDEKRIVRVSLTELERNITLSKDVVVAKTVERSSLKDGQVPLSKRMNSKGATTYLVSATDDDLLNKENALVSKALRTHLLRILPGDIQDECEDAIKLTLRNKVAQDPDAERKKLVDAFAAINVMPPDLKSYLGHDFGTSSPAEIVELREVYTAIKDGEATWNVILEQKTGKATKGEEPRSAVTDLTEKLKKERAAKPAKEAAPAAEPAKEPCTACGSRDGHAPGCPEAT